mgnify:CR=1 FL=1
MSYVDHAKQNLLDWFNKAKDWQRYIFCSLWNGKVDKDYIVSTAIDILNNDKDSCHNNKFNIDFPNDINFANNDYKVRMNCIKNVNGVCAIESEKSLSFEDGLNIIFGCNGSGKSSYTKLLKALAQREYANNIIGNVYLEDNIEPSAEVKFTIQGEEKVFFWSKNEKSNYPILIYDRDIASQFMDKEKEVLYEPRILFIFSRMVEIFDEMSKYFTDKIQKQEEQYKDKDKNIVKNELIMQFTKIDNIRDLETLRKDIDFTEEDNIRLGDIEEILKLNSPEDERNRLRSQLAILDRYKRDVIKLYNDLSCDKYKICKQKVEDYRVLERRKIDIISQSQNKSFIKDFGSDNWRKLWNLAKEYSASVTDDSSQSSIVSQNRCILCQQLLDNEAMERVCAFDDFVNSTIFGQFDSVEQFFKDELVQLKYYNIDNFYNREIDIDNLTIDQKDKTFIKDCYSDIISRYKIFYKLLDTKNYEDTIVVEKINIDKLNSKFDEIKEGINSKILLCDGVIKNIDKIIAEKNNLLSKKWIIENIENKKLILNYLKSKNSCKTNSITSLKKELSKILLTDAYIEKFNKEMKLLDLEQQIKVSLISSRAQKGHAYHQIILSGTKHSNKKIGQILSDGEYRLVSIAAFLADISSWSNDIPFIFDDPITSLDDNFEEAVAKRLIDLSKERQVIIFTHRLAFARYLENAVKNQNKNNDFQIKVKYTQLRKKPIGEPMELNVNLGFVSSLNRILNNIIPGLEKLAEKGEYDFFDHQVKAICSDIRIIVEKGIEDELLSGIVKRFSPNVSSMKLSRLNAMQKDDIDLFNKYMTKYSKYEHSQSVEIDNQLPSIDELKDDIKILIEWAKDYKKRGDKAQEKDK